MNTKISKSILGGIVGTIIMSFVMMIAPMMGMPKMSPPDMLAGMMGMPVMVGWVMHFMIGIIFALAYTYLFAPKVKIGNLLVKGAVFGFVVFIFAYTPSGRLVSPENGFDTLVMHPGMLKNPASRRNTNKFLIEPLSFDLLLYFES